MRRIACLAGLVLASPAFATDVSVPFTGTRTNLLDLHVGGAPYGYGLALGGRFGVPLLHNGFVDELNNSVYLNFGADLYNTYDRRIDGRGMGLGIPIAVQWNFYFTDEFSAFGELGANLYAGPAFFGGDAFLVDSTWLITSVGGRYHFSEATALHVRLGWPYASIGIELAM